MASKIKTLALYIKSQQEQIIFPTSLIMKLIGHSAMQHTPSQQVFGMDHVLNINQEAKKSQEGFNQQKKWITKLN